LGVSQDIINVTVADFDTDTTSTVTVDMSGVVKDATTETAVEIDVSAEQTSAMSLTGSKGANDTVEFGTHTTLSDLDITLSGIEKVTFDGGANFKAATLSGQTIEMTGSGTGIATLTGTDGDDTISSANLTAGTAAPGTVESLVITGGKGDDTITLGAMAEVVMVGSVANNGSDTVSEYTSGTDSIDLDTIMDTITKTYEEIASDTADITSAANVIVIGGDTTIDDAATLIAADADVTATNGIIVINGTDTSSLQIYHSSDLADNGTETLLVTLAGITDATSLVTADFVFA
jgi:hypothetical protein